MSVAFFVPINSKPGTPARVPPWFNLTIALVDGHGHVLLLGPTGTSPESGIPEHILWSQEGLFFREVWFMPAQWTLEMQCLGLTNFEVLNNQNAFQPPGTPASSVSHTTALLLIFHADADLKDIGHVNIGLVMLR